MGAKKISIDDFKGLSKDSLLGLTEKYFDKERIIKHLVKEFEDSPEAEIVLEELQLKKEGDAKVIALPRKSSQNPTRSMTLQFVSEIEDHQNRIVNDQKVEQEFVREIELLQEKHKQMSKSVKDLISELEKSEHQLEKQVDIIESVSMRNLKLNELFTKIKQSEDLTELVKLQDQFEQLMQEQLTELSFYTAITNMA
ncbi:MAG: hypothetical protein ACO2ZP_12730 [Bacteriovoracaceae bacterium]